jgi:hypothetical protein
MPNILDANGLQVATVPEITLNLQTAWQNIYGSDVNVNANSPDGQVIGIMAQNSSDILQLLVQVYNSFHPDNAFGTTLDARVAMNGIQRKAGSYTEAHVQVTVAAALTLTGQDALLLNPNAVVFAVADNAGNQFQLQQTYAFGAAGTVTLTFVAVNIGPVQTVANTIQTIATPQLNVVSVNNPSFSVSTTGNTTVGQPQITGIPSTAGMTAGMTLADTAANFPVGTTVVSVDSSTQITVSNNASGTTAADPITVATPPDVIGLPQETDPQLKIRRGNSFELQAVGPTDSIRAALLNLADVADAYIVENDTAGTVGGVPPNSIWIIVNGGTNAEIAQAIYSKKAPGCGMKGSVTQNVTRPQGSPFTAQWDVAVGQPLYIRATLFPRIAGQTFNVTADEIALAAALSYKLGQSPCIGDVVLAMNTIEPQAILSEVSVSKDNVNFINLVSPTNAYNYFTVSAANITLVNA